MSKKRNKFIDAHAHLTKEYYPEAIINEIVLAAYANRLEFIINNGGHRNENSYILELNEKFPILKPAIGIHPEDCSGANDYLHIKELLNDKVVAIGEIGLDYYYDDGAKKELQIASFTNQVKLALEKKLPVIIHIRDKENKFDAYDDVYNIMSQYKDVKFMLHTFAGTKEIAKKFMQLDCYFSFSGVITYGSNDNAREVIKIIPIDRLLIETDSPYLRPHPYTGEKNEPNAVLFTTYYAAGLKNMSVDSFVTKINGNLRKLFNLK